MKKRLQIGSQTLLLNSAPIHGEQVVINGENYYRIANYDRMRPFFMSIVSSSDHWLFISSNGALTAGRRTAELALFPYYTDDKIHDSAEITGSKTMLIVRRGKRNSLWEPFSDRYRGLYRIRRSLYKSFCGDKIMFEEANEDLGMVFRYEWCFSDRFGLVRKPWLTYTGPGKVGVSLLDGVQNLLPCGLGSQLQLEKSTLVDAYKKNELLPETGLGLFLLSSLIADRPEPAESLRANTVWSAGLNARVKLLSSVQLNSFRQGEPLRLETDVRAERGAYFLQAELSMRRGQVKNWLLVAEVNQGPADIVALNASLREAARLRQSVEQDIEQGTSELRQIVASADGLQKSAHALGNARHFSNVLFNVMRGGIFRDGYQVDPGDLRASVHHANQGVATRQTAFFKKLNPGIHYSRVIQLAAETGDAHLERLCREYLPLTFSRRHGDPSRPWNRFSIPARNADGSRILNYEGNWRDIFQNWEALAISFPGYTSGMICKFINASTADGYNPYRISRNGIDWEVIDPADPWSHIGYWGDHQVVYLLKLLEILDRHEPGSLRGFLQREIFAYANVPYRIKPYAELLKNPKETVVFDETTEQLTHRRVQQQGSDGKLIWDDKEQVHLVNLAEKLTVLVLAKLSNFIPEAGIWLNTQRPEWNDANNALVGNGASMVTLYYLRRFLSFCRDLFRPLGKLDVNLSEEVGHFLQALTRILQRHQTLLAKPMTDRDRRRLLDDLGQAGNRYREQIYTQGFSGRKLKFKGTQFVNFLEIALEWTDGSISLNRRTDGLYHAYNLISLDQKKISIRRLYEMLEGQVAVLSSGSLSAKESLHVLLALKKSAIYRADQHSYLLYPDRQLPRFVGKNNIPAHQITRSKLLGKLIADREGSLIVQDIAGGFHFNGSLTNARDVKNVLERLADLLPLPKGEGRGEGEGNARSQKDNYQLKRASNYAQLARTDTPLILEIFEHCFDHQSFTGRSGTFFGYEGLGCIYWHMVSKLLLAAQETFFRAADAGSPDKLLAQLRACYYDIRAGIGDHKSPEVYGAFPLDPYSHTPGHTGARQPGLTGQVKEDILCRFGELGVFVRQGRIHFQPLLLRREEFLKRATQFCHHDVSGAEERIDLKPDSLAFTYCQVPIVYRLAPKHSLNISFADGSVSCGHETRLEAEVSRYIFDRSGKVKRVDVALDLT